MANNDAVDYATVRMVPRCFMLSRTYVLTTLATFGVLLVLSRNGLEAETQRPCRIEPAQPYYAAIMDCALSLGIPPLVGFYAKLGCIAVSAGDRHGSEPDGDYVYQVLMSSRGAFYYLRVIKGDVLRCPAEDR